MAQMPSIKEPGVTKDADAEQSTTLIKVGRSCPEVHESPESPERAAKTNKWTDQSSAKAKLNSNISR